MKDFFGVFLEEEKINVTKMIVGENLFLKRLKEKTSVSTS